MIWRDRLQSEARRSYGTVHKSSNQEEDSVYAGTKKFSSLGRHTQRGQGDNESRKRRLRGPYSFLSRFENGSGTNPEELIGAAEAGCSSMALSSTSRKLASAKRISTARRDIGNLRGGPKITTIELETEADVPGMDEQAFQEQAEKTKAGLSGFETLAGTRDQADREARLVGLAAASYFASS